MRDYFIQCKVRKHLRGGLMRDNFTVQSLLKLYFKRLNSIVNCGELCLSRGDTSLVTNYARCSATHRNPSTNAQFGTFASPLPPALAGAAVRFPRLHVLCGIRLHCFGTQTQLVICRMLFSRSSRFLTTFSEACASIPTETDLPQRTPHL